MQTLDTLPLESNIVVSTGTPKHDRRLSDKILAAFGHAYAEGAIGVAAVLRRALEEAQGTLHGAPAERRAHSGHGAPAERRAHSGYARALVQADLWVAFVDSRDAFRRASAAQAPDLEALEQARAEMMDAYKAWSYG
jgi:hypothetical protein